MKQRRGTTLGTVVMLLSASLFFVLGVGSVSVMNARLSNQNEFRDHARNLAESAIAQALAQIAAGESFGANRAAGQAIRIQMPGTPASWQGLLTFHPGEAAAFGVPVSHNFAAQDTPQPGSAGRTVPRNCLQLIGVGICGPARYQAECIYFKPPYPYGLGASNTVEASHLVIGGLKPGSVFSGDYESVAASDKLPAHIYSNSSEPVALRLGPNCLIRGNAGAVGNVLVDPASRVLGEVQPYSFPRPVPQIDIDGMISQISGAASDWSFSGAGLAPVQGGGDGQMVPFTGYRVLNSSASFAGDLNLAGCALYVQGNLNVAGTIRGQGIILATGAVTVGQGAHFEASQSLALCAKGDVTLAGSSRSNYFFHGMVYSEGNVRASRITVLGSVIANGRGNPLRGKMTLEDSAIIPGGGASVTLTAMGIPFNPLYLNTGSSGNSGGNTDEDNDAMTVRVDGYRDANGTPRYNAYIWYALDEDFLEQGGSNGYMANYYLLGNATTPFVIENCTRAELQEEINKVMHRCNCDDESGGAPFPTYAFTPTTSTPVTLAAGVPPYPSPRYQLCHPLVQRKINEAIEAVTSNSGPVLSVDLNRITPATERPRILLYRPLP